MSWIDSRQFQIADRNGRHYVFRRTNAGNTEINIPKTITTKAEAVRWLKAHPEKVAKPNRYRGKRAVPKLPPHVMAAFDPFAPAVPTNRRLSPTHFFTHTSPTYGGAPKRNSPNVGTPKTNMSVSNFKKSLKKMEQIGAGRQGVAYRATQGKKVFVLKVAPYDLHSKKRGEPQPGDVEYKIHSACQKVAPEGVVTLYSHIHALDFVDVKELKQVKNLDSPHYELQKQNIIVMELCGGGSLEKWFREHKPSDALMKRIITQVLTTLRKIMEKYPDFRHNDLHLENIFVSRSRGFLIADFGWARLMDKGTNPAVNTANGTKTASYYGVGPKTSSRYDMHLFLNNMRTVCVKNAGYVPETLKFLDAVLPPGYRGASDTHVNDFRLKYEDPCPGLPSLTKVLSHPYLRGKLVTSPMLMEARAKLRAKAPKKPVRITSAELLAGKARLRRVRGPSPPKRKTYTNAELIALNRADLFKLSPRTRERAVKLRAALKPAKNVKKAANKAKRTASPKTEKRPPVPRNVLKSAKFNKLVERLWRNAGDATNNGWNKARNKALRMVENRIMRGIPPLSPNSPKKAKTPEKPKASPPKVNYKFSPKSGRVKIKAPNTGRYVYANGGSVSLEYLKSLASRLQVNIKGLRSKAAIANKIFKHNK